MRCSVAALRHVCLWPPGNARRKRRPRAKPWKTGGIAQHITGIMVNSAHGCVVVALPEFSKHVVRFGVFEVNFESAEIRKQGVKLRLQEQPLQVLAALLERPGEVVT